MFPCSCPAQFSLCTFWWNQFSCALLYCFHPLTHPRVFVKLPVTAGEKKSKLPIRELIHGCVPALPAQKWELCLLKGLLEVPNPPWGFAWFWCCCSVKNTLNSAVAQRESMCFEQGEFSCQGLPLPRGWSTAEQFSHLQLADCATAFVLPEEINWNIYLDNLRFNCPQDHFNGLGIRKWTDLFLWWTIPPSRPFWGEIFHISSFCDKNPFTFPVSVVKSFRFPVSLWGGNGWRNSWGIVMWRLQLGLAFSLNCHCKQPWLPREWGEEKLRFSQDAPVPAHRAKITVCAFPAQSALFDIKFRRAPEILLEFVSTWTEISVARLIFPAVFVWRDI